MWLFWLEEIGMGGISSGRSLGGKTSGETIFVTVKDSMFDVHKDSMQLGPIGRRS